MSQRNGIVAGFLTKTDQTMNPKIYLFALLLWAMQFVMGTPPDKDPVNQQIDEMITVIRQVRKTYQIRKQDVYKRQQQIGRALAKATDLETKVNLLIQKDALQQQLKSLADEEAFNIIKNLILRIALLKSTVVK